MSGLLANVSYYIFIEIISVVDPKERRTHAIVLIVENVSKAKT